MTFSRFGLQIMSPFKAFHMSSSGRDEGSALPFISKPNKK